MEQAQSTPAPNAASREQKDGAIAQATTLTDEALNQIDNGQFDKAVYLAGAALDIVIKEWGELSFEACRFYYALADAQLAKIENSNDPLNSGGAATAIAKDSNNPSNQNVPADLMQAATEKIKEMFQQAGAPIPPTTLTTTTTPPPKPTPETPTEKESDSKPSLPSKAKPIPESSSTPSPPTADTPQIKDEEDEEEEIITTTKNTPEEEKKEEEKEEIAIPEEDYSDEFRAPWESLEVAIAILDKTQGMYEDKREFERANWNTRADILERQADLEIARENIKEGIRLYNVLIDLCVSHNCDRLKSRTIAGILFKIGCGYQFVPESQQAAMDSFFEASTILSGILIEDVKTHNPEEGGKLQVADMKDNAKLKEIEINSDKAKELQALILEINNKIEEWKVALVEKPILDKAKVKAEPANTFKKPAFQDKAPVNLGSFGKGKKRSHDEANGESKVENKEGSGKETTATDESHKRQKVEESG